MHAINLKPMSSFIADKIVMDGLTYDDVLLIPAYSEVLPRTVELTTKFSRHIELKVPFVTAAMDTCLLYTSQEAKEYGMIDSVLVRKKPEAANDVLNP